MITRTLLSDAAAVREFTAGAGQPTPRTPQEMSRDEVDFLGKMIIDELLEFYATVMGPEEAKATIKAHVDTAKAIPKMEYPGDDTAEKIADQADALVDIYYYSLNAAAKKGVNMSSLFQIVHAANMAKRDPETGKFLKREDGKIIKPAGWMPPDVGREIRRQMAEGAFPDEEEGEGAGSEAAGIAEAAGAEGASTA